MHSGGENRGEAVLGKVQSFSDIISAFFEESENSTGSISDVDAVAGERGTAPENKSFRESQFQLLKVTLAKTSSLEARIRRDAERLLATAPPSGTAARSSCAVDAGDCKMVAVCEGLRAAGYDCAVCKSKWKSFHHLLSGEHSYLNIIHRSAARKNPVRVVVEVDFRSEFDIARAGEDYKALVGSLPELFVGKPEKLRSVIKVVCSAAKRCMKDNGLHMGPWRKHDYMLSKWFGPSTERAADAMPTLAMEAPPQRPKMRASLLTSEMVGIVQSTSSLHCTAAVGVV